MFAIMFLFDSLQEKLPNQSRVVQIVITDQRQTENGDTRFELTK